MVARQHPPAIRQHGERRNDWPATRMGSVHVWDGPASLARRLARSAGRVLWQVDRRRKVFHFPIEPSDLGTGAKSQLSSFRTKTHSCDFQPAVVVVSASQQGWQEVVCDRADLPWRTHALRREVRQVLAVSRGHLCRIRCLLKGWPVGDLCFVSRGLAMAKQGGRE